MLVRYARAVVSVGEIKHRWNIKLGPIAAIFSAALLASCTAAPPAPSLTAAADPQARVPAARYSSVTAPYTRQRPVEPLPWRERNERVAPQGAQ